MRIELEEKLSRYYSFIYIYINIQMEHVEFRIHIFCEPPFCQKFDGKELWHTLQKKKYFFVTTEPNQMGFPLKFKIIS